MRNSTESHQEFVVKKAVGLAFGLISAVSALGVYVALRRIVYPARDAKEDEYDEYDSSTNSRSRAESESTVYMIVLKLFMATAVSDIIFSLNNVLTFYDWDDQGVVCKIRGAWFQVGFQSSFMFTAFTAFELYRMISTRKYGSRDQYVHCRFVGYVMATVLFTVAVVAILSFFDGWGPMSQSNRHTLCYLNTTNPPRPPWMGYLAMAPSGLSWISCCIFVLLAARQLRVLSRNLPFASAGGQQDQMHDQSRTRFHAFISKMLAFPGTTFCIWLLPLLNVLVFIKFDNFWLELLNASIMNSQGLKNAILLLCTNALVRREVYGWFCGPKSGCYLCCCGRGGVAGEGRGEGQGLGGDYEDSSYMYMEDNYEDADEFADDDYKRGKNQNGGGLYGGLGNGGSGRRRERDRAITEDVLIGAVTGGSEEGSEYDGDGRYDDDFNEYAGGGKVRIDSSAFGESKNFRHNRNITPQLPSLNNSFDPSPPKF